jgi:hypothetical protein
MVNQDNTLRLPVFHGMGKDDVEQHWFTSEEIWSMKRITDETTKIVHLETMFRNKALMWYMKYKATMPIGWIRSLVDIKRDLLKEFQNPKSKSQYVSEIKDIKQQQGKIMWDYDQWFKILLDRLMFQI